MANVDGAAEISRTQGPSLCPFPLPGRERKGEEEGERVVRDGDPEKKRGILYGTRESSYSPVQEGGIEILFLQNINSLSKLAWLGFAWLGLLSFIS